MQKLSQQYLKPVGFDITQESDDVHRYVQWGIQHLPQIAEIYPVGGAGDRIDLVDEETGEPLPAAVLLFCGRTLLEGLLRDLQAKEYLYHKLYGIQLVTPIVLMTSEEKDNHRRVAAVCASCGWFGRPQESFFFITQTSVPVVTYEGHWSMKDVLELSLKPGGHGVLWKLAKDSGAFEWLASHRRTKALLRQINNPVAGTDRGILALCGIGCKKKKAFGFASCPRRLHAAEGMIVLVDEEHNGGHLYRISNIEYTDFKKKGLEDVAETQGSPYSKFPANTNILFADVQAVHDKIPDCPLPGMLINLKNDAPYIDEDGNASRVPAGRLETTMQNISDAMVSKSSHQLHVKQLLELETFLTYNDRRKTISVTKQAYAPQNPISDTPEGCFWEMMHNACDLLEQECGIKIPPLCSEEEYLKKGPNILFLYHPALGPLYSIIAQKIRGGTIGDGSELQLDIAETYLEALELQGSLLIQAEMPVGTVDDNGLLHYGKNQGRCILKNVSIVNQGIDRDTDNVYWKNRIRRLEEMRIVLKGNAEFFAENVHFQGHHNIIVPDGYRWEAVEKNDKVVFQKEKISDASWSWEYRLGTKQEILLSMRSSKR